MFSTLSCLCCVLTQISVAESQRKEPQRKESHPHTLNEASAAVTSQSDCFTQRNSLFNKEVLQVKWSMQARYQQFVITAQSGALLHESPAHEKKSCSFLLLLCVPSYNWKLIKCLRSVCFFHSTLSRICRWRCFKSLSNEATASNLSESLIFKWEEAGAGLSQKATSCADEIRMGAACRMTLRGGQSMRWFLFCPENCTSCVRLRGREGGETATSEAII